MSVSCFGVSALRGPVSNKLATVVYVGAELCTNDGIKVEGLKVKAESRYAHISYDMIHITCAHI